MANPNIVNVSAIYGNTTYYTPLVTTAVVLLANAASSGKVYKINQIVAANINNAIAVAATVAIYTNGAVAKGSAPAGGTAYPIAAAGAVTAAAGDARLSYTSTSRSSRNTFARCEPNVRS